MMHNTKNPATLATCGAPKSFKLAAQNGLDNSNFQPDFQRRRAAWLARRANISPSLAAVLAPFFFGLEAR